MRKRLVVCDGYGTYSLVTKNQSLGKFWVHGKAKIISSLLAIAKTNEA
ncbi:hypothetical protein [Calothrix rhizosoleniae]|nr:hypothetical protein [Calothrix rhizosoleniae]